MTNTYEVGYAKPPVKTQFKPGKSGNPKGRPKGSKNTYKLLDDLLAQKLSITQDGKKTKIDKRTMSLLQLVNKSVKGDFKSTQALLPMMIQIDENNEQKERMLEALHRDDKKILEEYKKRILEGNKLSDETAKEVIDV